jgi:hypothetical protein
MICGQVLVFNISCERERERERERARERESVCVCVYIYMCCVCICVCVCVCAATQIRAPCGTSQFVPWSNMINSTDDRPLKRVWSDDRPLIDKDKCKTRILISAATRYLSHKNAGLRTRWSEFEFQTGILQAFVKSREASSRLSVYQSAWNTSAPTGPIFIKLHIWVFFENLSKKN